MSATEYPTFAFRSPSSGALPARARSGGRLELLVIAAGICLPVPAFAATGLSVPLPNVVERIAAALVPWADPVALDASEHQGSSGTIVPTAAETGLAPRLPGASAAPAAAAAKRPAPTQRAVTPLSGTPASRLVPTGGGAAPAPTPTATPGGTDRTGTAVPAAGGDAPVARPETASKPAEAPATTPPSGSGGGTVKEPPAPTPDPAPADPLPLPVPLPTPVDEVATAATDPVGTVGGAVADPVGGVVKTPLLPGIGK